MSSDGLDNRATSGRASRQASSRAAAGACVRGNPSQPASDVPRPASRRASRGYALFVVLVFASCMLVLWTGLFAYSKAAEGWVMDEWERRQASWSARAGLVHRVSQFSAGLARDDVAYPPVADLEYAVTESRAGSRLLLVAEGVFGGYVASEEWELDGTGVGGGRGTRRRPGWERSGRRVPPGWR